MKIKMMQIVLMNNNEMFFAGRSLGFIKEEELIYLFEPKANPEGDKR